MTTRTPTDMKARIPEVVFDMPTHNRFGMEYPGGGYVVVRWTEVEVPTPPIAPATGIAAKNPQRESARIRSVKPGAPSSEQSPTPSKK